MERTLQGNVRMTGRITSISFSRGLGWGLIGGLAGTMIMDLILNGSIICSWIASSDLLLDRWKYRCAFLFDAKHGDGTRHSNGYSNALSCRTGDRSNLWDGSGAGRSSAGEYSEKEHPLGDPLC